MSDSQPMTPRGAWLMAAVFVIAGALVLAAALGVIGSGASWRDTPRWVGAAAGLVFIAGAFVPLSAMGIVSQGVGRAAGLVLMVALAAVFHWVAFGPGTRHFSGSTSILAVSSGPVDASQRTGRIVFGAFALLVDAVIVASVVQWVRARSKGER